VQKHTAQLTRANEALRQDAEQLSAIIATQHDIATAGHNFMAVMTLIAERAQKLTRAMGAAIELIERDELVYRVGPAQRRDMSGCGSQSRRVFRENACDSTRFSAVMTQRATRE